MKVNKVNFFKGIERQFFLLLPIMVMVFFPSKELMGKFSLPDLFIFFQFILFSIYSLYKMKIFVSNEIIILLILILFCVISLFLTNYDDILYKAKYLIRWVNYFLTFVIAYHFFDKSNYKFFMKGIYLMTFLVCLYGILQKLFFDVFFKTIFWIHTFPDYIYLIFRSVSFLDNPLNLCAFLAFPLGTLQFDKEMKRLNVFLVLMIYITIALTASKIAIVLIALSVLVYLSKFKKFFKYLLVITPFMLVTVFSSSLYKTINSKYGLYDRLTNKNTYQASVNTRLLMYESSFVMIKDNFMWGIGNENFKKNFDELTNRDNNYKITNSSYTAENFFLDFYLDYGLIPLIVILTLLVPVVISYYYGFSALKPLSFSILLYIVVGLIMSARAVPLLYLFFFYLAIFYKKQRLIINENY